MDAHKTSRQMKAAGMNLTGKNMLDVFTRQIRCVHLTACVVIQVCVFVLNNRCDNTCR
jgi:hypothetical protein